MHTLGSHRVYIHGIHKSNHLSQRVCDVQIVFTTVGYIKLDHLPRKMCYTNCVIKS